MTPPEEPGALITSAAAATILGCSSDTVVRMVGDGRLTAAQRLPGPNGAYLFRAADVEASAQKAGRS